LDDNNEKYYTPAGGLPQQRALMSSRACFTESYAVIPRRVMTDIVTSRLPLWNNTRAWVLARPLSGFAETFSQMIVEVSPEGGSNKPEQDTGAECVIFITKGTIKLTHKGTTHTMVEGSYAYLPAGDEYALKNTSAEICSFHWIRKKYIAIEGMDYPSAVFMHEDDAFIKEMPDTVGGWKTTSFVDTEDTRHDMHVNIVTFEPGACIPFLETHVMEHGLFVLEGKGVYRLNKDWVEVEAGDFMWLRAFCPQGCYAGGPGRFRYLLYKDVHRHPNLTL